MQLYFSPLACSMATRISLYEAGADAAFARVDLKAKRVADGSDYLGINPMGQVPALRTDEGEVLTENPVVLQYVADRFPNSGLAAEGADRYRVQQWLSFVGTELHKAVFTPLFAPTSNDGAKAFAHAQAERSFGVLDRHLAGREFLLGRFTIADAYLVTVLNWAPLAGVDRARWPEVEAYYQRLVKRPSIARALGEELALTKKSAA